MTLKSIHQVWVHDASCSRLVCKTLLSSSDNILWYTISSSVKRHILEEMLSEMSWIYRRNRTGPITEPGGGTRCGRYFIRVGTINRNVFVQLCKKDAVQFLVSLWTPYYSSLLSKHSCGTWSNTLDKSSRMQSTCCLASIDLLSLEWLVWLRFTWHPRLEAMLKFKDNFELMKVSPQMA